MQIVLTEDGDQYFQTPYKKTVDKFSHYIKRFNV
jgi:hypothetical protein